MPLDGVATWDADGFGASRMLASGDGDVVLSSRGEGTGSLQRFEIATGANVWSFDFASPPNIFTAPGFAFGPGGEVAAMWEGELHAVDASGVEIWSAPAAPVDPECTYEPISSPMAPSHAATSSPPRPCRDLCNIRGPLRAHPGPPDESATSARRPS